MSEINDNGLPLISANALRYKQLHDDAVKGRNSTVFGGFGARLGWAYGRPLLGKGLRYFKSKDPAAKGFIINVGNRLGRAGDWLLNDSANRTTKHRVLQGVIDAGFGAGGLATGAHFGSKVITPIQLSLEEGLGSGTSSKNIQGTYDRLFGGLTPTQQKSTLDRIEKYNTSVYGTDKIHSGVQKLLNVTAGIGGGIAGDRAANNVIDTLGLKGSNTVTGKALRGGIKFLGNYMGTSGGISLASNAFNKLHGDTISPVPAEYYEPNDKNTNLVADAGRQVNSVLNAMIPGREFSHPMQVALSPGSIVSAEHRKKLREISRSKGKYERTLGRVIKPVEEFLIGTVNKPMDTLMGQDTDWNPYN